MTFLPFKLSYLVLTPSKVRLPGEAPPRSSHRDRRGSKDSTGANTTHTSSTSRSMGRSPTSASSSRWSTRFRRALNPSAYKSPSSTSVPPVEASAPTLPPLTPPPPVASTSYGHSRSMSHPQVLESMVGGIPFPTIESTEELIHHRRPFSQVDYGYSYHRVAAGEFGQLPVPRNDMALIDAAATAVAVASLGGVVEDIGRNRRYIDDDDEEDYGREITPMAYAI